MRKITMVFMLFCMCVISYNMKAQAPEKFNYQAILRNSNGELVKDQEVTIQISIIEGSVAGTTIYREQHIKTTNEFGMFDLLIGNGTSNIGTFASINWGTSTKYIKVETNTGSGFVDMGTAQLLSVPFSLYSNKAKILDNTALYFTDSDTLFAVKDHDGNIVFAVFTDGAKVYVNEFAKGKVGGFAVSGRTSTKLGEEFDYLQVTPDSTRIYINEDTTAKGKIGGFAVSGRTSTKGNTNDYLQVSRDSTKIYITESETKGKIGGFAVSGRTSNKAGLETKDYFNISRNTLAEEIKNESRVMWYPEKSAFLAGEVHVGGADSVGQNSTALGYRSIAMGEQSQAFGYKSLAYGSFSTAIGYEAESDTNSMAVGFKAKASGNDAFAMGSGALAIADKSFAFGSTGIDSLGNTTGIQTRATGEYSYAIGLGCEASKKGAFAMGANNLASGEFSTAFGFSTTATKWYSTATGAHTLADGFYSTAMGFKSEALKDASIAIGFSTKSNAYGAMAIGMYSYANGSNSVAIGYDTYTSGLSSTAFGNSTNATANYAIAMGDNCTASGQWSMAAGGSNTASNYYSTALGRGTLAKNFGVFVLGQYNLEIGTTVTYPVATNPLFVVGNGIGPGTGDRTNALVLYWDGDLTIAGALTEGSDIRIKENIVYMENILPKIQKINPAYFEFIDKRAHPDGRHIGFIAQEIEPLFPELVKKDSNGYLSLEYANMTAVLLQAIKEQQAIIDLQTQKNKEFENKLIEMNKKLDEIEGKLK